MAYDPRFESDDEQPAPPTQKPPPPAQQEPPPPTKQEPPSSPPEEEGSGTGGSLIDLSLTADTDVDGESESGGLASGFLSALDVDATVGGGGDDDAGSLIDVDINADTDGEGDSGGLAGGFSSALDVDATVGGGGDSDSEAGSLIDIDANADTTGNINGGLIEGGLLGGDLLGGDLVGGDLFSGTFVDGVLGNGSGGSDPSLLNVDLKGETETDGSVIDLGAEEIVGEDSLVTVVAETAEDTVDQLAGEFDGGDLLGDELLDGIDVGDTLAQLGAGDLLDTGLTEDLSDVGAITGIVDEVVDTASTVEGLLGENDLFNILDTDCLLGDG